MAQPFQREDRLKSLFKRELLSIFQTSMKDPLFEGESLQIVDISLAKDASSAYIYISVLNKDKELSIISLLQSKSLWIRKYLGKKMHLKKIPKFYFVQDDSLTKMSYMNALLDKIKNEK